MGIWKTRAFKNWQFQIKNRKSEIESQKSEIGSFIKLQLKCTEPQSIFFDKMHPFTSSKSIAPSFHFGEIVSFHRPSNLQSAKHHLLHDRVRRGADRFLIWLICVAKSMQTSLERQIGGRFTLLLTIMFNEQKVLLRASYVQLVGSNVAKSGASINLCTLIVLK